MNPTFTQLHSLSDQLRALSDGTRLRILLMLSGGERCQCEIKDELGTAQPLLAHHLKTLKDAGLVRGRRRGRWVFYSLCCDAVADIGDFIAGLTTASPEAGCCDLVNLGESSSQPRGHNE